MFSLSVCSPLMADDQPFYLTLVRNVKDEKMSYTKVPVRQNTLGSVVKNVCKEADIAGCFTSHSLRVTTASRGLEKGFRQNCYKYTLDITRVSH